MTTSRRFDLGDERGYFDATAPGMWEIMAPDDVVYIIWWSGNPCSGSWCPNVSGKMQTASTYFDSSQGTQVAWLDGHAKYMKVGALAAGTDYGTAVPGGISGGGGAVLTDKTKYLWNLDDNYYGG